MLRRDLIAMLGWMGVTGKRTLRPRVISGLTPLDNNDAPEAVAAPLILAIDGPLVVTASLRLQRELFEGVFGLSLVADQELDPPAVKALFGMSDRTARTILLQTLGTSIGVRLVEFRPSSQTAVREGSKPIDADALKVVDFMVPDFAKALAALTARGFRLASPPADYTTPEDGRFTEGHVEGPDGVVCAILKMHDTPLSKYVTVTNQVFSEILGVSAPVSDREAAVSFYRDTLKLDTILSYEIANESFQKLLGSKDKTLLSGRNFGASRKASSKAPMLGVIHYGLPTSAFRSLRDRSILPNRGLQAIRFSVSSIAQMATFLAPAGVEVIAPAAETVLFPQGRVKSLLIRAPHGVLHHFTETLPS